MNRFEWTEATTTAAAIAQMSRTATVKAGGIDLLDRLKEGIDAPARLVNIRNIRGLDYIREDSKTGLHIGPLVTLAQLDAHPLLRARYTALADAAGKAATPQIRNVATVGGNLLQRPRCWYFRSEDFHCRKKGGTVCFALEGENQYHAIFGNRICAIVHPSATATALVAFGAFVELTGAKGKREVELEKFFITPEEDITRENSIGEKELVTNIRVPLQPSAARSAYLKQGEKESFDWPIADVAVRLDCKAQTCTSARIVLGAAAPVPLRAVGAEAVLQGKTVNEDAARAAARAAVKDATPLSQNGYKVPVFEALVRRAIVQAAAVASPTRGDD
ncbi:MAG TPA: FAD binding domain-containing protein [Pyrinomonadaceae bacterium]|jgi:xanthine dehydrogenase YagS FAD-binding subunit